METVEVTETLAVLPDQLVIQFKKVGNDIQVHKVRMKNEDDDTEDDIPPQLGVPSGTTYPLGSLVKYIKNPTCIGFVIGGSYYEICF